MEYDRDRESGAMPLELSSNATRTQSGVALLMAVFVTLLILGVMLSSSLSFDSDNARSESLVDRERHASQLADAGLTEALGWFRSRTRQPVTSFRTTSRALVRSFRIMDQLWGRFEVYPDNYEDHRLRAIDRSLEVLDAEPGQIWQLHARAYIYLNKSPTTAFDQQPNHVLASAERTAELRRFKLFFPAMAAPCSGDAQGFYLGENVTVDSGGNGACLAVARGTGEPSLGEARVLGEPVLYVMSEYDDDDAAVLGAPLDVLARFADMVVRADQPFPTHLRKGSLILVEGDRVIENNTRITGEGALVLLGDFDLRRGCELDYTGIIYARQDFRIEGRIVLRGMLIGKKAIFIDGAAEDQSSLLVLDELVIDRIRKNLGRYRLSSSMPTAADPASTPVGERKQ